MNKKEKYKQEKLRESTLYLNENAFTLFLYVGGTH